MKTSLIALLALSLAGQLNAAPDGKALLEKKCSSCHMLSSSTKIKQDKISAPPMWGVMRNIYESFASNEEGIAFIIDYVKYPSEEKMVFPKAAKERFGLMPSMKDDLSDEELKAIAEYLYKDR